MIDLKMPGNAFDLQNSLKNQTAGVGHMIIDINIVAKVSFRMHVMVMVCFLIGACGSQRTLPASPSHSSSIMTTASSSATRIIERSDWSVHLQAENVSGTVAILDGQNGKLYCYHSTECRRPFIPASTFKIPSSIIGLETGVISGPEQVIPWDGISRELKSWNRDHSLRTAFKESVVPYYQELARGVGAKRMAEWIHRLEYGNKNISGGLDRFWLQGGLRISPVEQTQFLRRFNTAQLPINNRTRMIVRDIMVRSATSNYVLRAKTGYAYPAKIGWYVGWVERGDHSLYFATLLYQLEWAHGGKRQSVTERLLKSLGWI